MDKDFDQLQIAYRLPWDEFVVWVASERSKAVKEGHQAALESKVLSELRYAVERALTLKPGMPNREWFESVIEDFDKFKEDQK